MYKLEKWSYNSFRLAQIRVEGRGRRGTHKGSLSPRHRDGGTPMQLAADAGEAFAKTTDVAAIITADERKASSIALPVVCAIICSLPFGILAMLFALRGRAALAEGDFKSALRQKRRSVLFSWVAVAWTAFIVIAYLILATG